MSYSLSWLLVTRHVGFDRTLFSVQPETLSGTKLQHLIGLAAVIVNAFFTHNINKNKTSAKFGKFDSESLEFAKNNLFSQLTWTVAESVEEKLRE